MPTIIGQATARGHVEPPFLARIWERMKQGASLQLFGVRLLVKFRRASPLTMNRWLLFRKRIGLLIAGRPPEPLIPSVADDRRISERVSGVAVIVGVGDGLGSSLVKHLAESGMRVAAIARSRANLDALVEREGWSPEQVHLYSCDATNEASFSNALECVRSDLGAPNLVIYLVQYSMSGDCINIEPTALEESWRANCLGAFIVARASARLMTPRGSGTIIFAGATSGIIGRPGYLGLATGKFALRALSQVLARELWPHGIHVVHVLIDGGSFYFGKDRDVPDTDPEAAAKSFLMLHRQAKNVWTHELDLRPWNERFWSHC